MSVDPRTLSSEQAARVRKVLAAGGPPAVPRDAATVVLLRDAPGSGVEAYLLRRVASMSFAAGMYVFPGGSVDPRDADVSVGWSGPPPASWASILAGGDEGLARALVCAAVRETFEESGVLLAGPTDDTVVDIADPAWDEGGWETARQALLDRSVALAPLLADRGLVLRADLLRPWAHWITPEEEPRRFDTRFFVAALPEGQTPREVGGEADRVVWRRPDQALEEHRSGGFALMAPTSFTLAELAEHGSVAEVLEAATARDIQPVLPKVIVTGDSARVLLPGEDGFSS